MKCLENTLLHLAADEGRATALRIAQNVQLSLETIMEAGNKTEISAAIDLLKVINRTILEINEGSLVALIKKGDADKLDSARLKQAGITIVYKDGRLAKEEDSLCDT